MREIQTEIRRDRIENDNRKNELQNKAQSGLKTAKTNTESKQENTQTINRSSEQDKQQTTKTVQQASSSEPSNSYKGEEVNGEATQSAAESTFPEISETAPTTQNDTTDREIQSQVGSDNVESGVKHDVIQNKAQSGLKTAKTKTESKQENRQKCKKAKARVAGAVRAASAVGAITSEILQGAVPNENDGLGSESASELKKAALDITSRSLDAVKRISEKKIQAIDEKKPQNLFMERIAKKLKAKVKKVRGRIAEKVSNSAAAEKIRYIKKEIHKTKVKIVDKINNTAVLKKVKEVKNKAAEVTKKIKDKVKKVKKKVVRKIIKLKRRVLKTVSIRRLFDKSSVLSEKNVKRLRKTVTRAKNRKVNRKKRLNKIVTKVKAKVKAFAKKMKSCNDKANKAFRKSKGTISKGAAGAVNAVSKVKAVSSSDDAGNDLARISKDIAVKGAESSYNAVKTVITKPVKAVKKRIKNEKTRTVKTAEKNVGKTRKIHKSVKSTAQTTKKVKKTEKTAKTASKSAVETAKTTGKAAAKVISGIAKAISALMIPIIIVIAIVVIFNVVSGTITIPVSIISSIGSSLSWLFGGGNSGSDEEHSNDIAELYRDFEQKAISAMQSARQYYMSEINGISIDERDLMEFNGTSYYPASFAVQNYVGAYFYNNFSYGDYPYLMQLCYIKKLRDKRAEQGLSENDIPEVTIEESDILSFITTYCYEFEITEKPPPNSCPTSNCRSVTWHHPNGYCPDVAENEDCIGHLSYYCDRSHKKLIIKFQEVSKDVLENNVLNLTDSEKSMLETGIKLINDSLQP